MLNPYLGIVLLFVVVAGFLILMLVLSTVLGPRFSTRTKRLPFECGAVSVGSVGDHRFNVRFYLVAMLFILFDVEVIFMYPWAVTLQQLGWASFIAMSSFMLVLGGGLVYVWRKGVLDWNEGSGSQL